MRWYQRLFRRTQTEKQLDSELRFHLERQVADYVASGMTPEEARRRARLEFGGLEQMKEECREIGAARFIETLIQDLRYGLRQLRRNPGFTAVAVLTLALGIGANTAIFSVIDAVMLRMLPVRQPERLVQIGFQGKHAGESFVGESFSYPVFNELLQYNRAFTGISAFDYWDTLHARAANPETRGTNQPIRGQIVSANFFSLLGIKPIMGRTFAADEDNGTGAHPVAVISFALWARRFGRNPDVLGKKLVIQQTSFTVIGVAPPHFSGIDPRQVYDIWVPVSMQPEVLPGGNRLAQIDTNWLSLIARLKPGVSVGQARASLDILYQEIQRQRDISKWSPQDRRDFFTYRIVLMPAARGANYLRTEFSRPLFLLMGMVVLVLVIACTNVANLLLARASTRQREIALRLALGARRRRLVRQLLTESTLLAVIGGAFGLIFACWGSPVLVALMSNMANSSGRVTLNVYPDLLVLGFTMLLALGTGVAFGLAPSLRVTRRSSGSSITGWFHAGPGPGNLGRVLVVAQVALSLVVVVGAGLLVGTLHNLETLNPGFNRDHVLLFGLDPSKAGYKPERAAQLRRDVLERIQHAPGVRSASFSFLTPISGGGWDNYVRSVEGYTAQPGESVDVYLNAVGPNFFKTLGTPLLAGRNFGPEDNSGSSPVALINETMARRFFGNQSPLGKHFRLGPWSGKSGYEIIGVTGDAKYLSLRETVPPTAYLYIPELPPIPMGTTFEVRTAIAPLSVVPEVRSILRSIDPSLRASDVKTLAEQVDQSLDQEEMMSTLSSFFGVVALALACIGLYGVMSYAVARRASEIGIRMALGAQKRDVLSLVIGQGLSVTLAGLGIGLLGALGLTRFLSSLLYGVRPTDPLTFLLASLILTSTALLACYIPARRAAKVDPMIALRHE
jgi:predicted permease